MGQATDQSEARKRAEQRIEFYVHTVVFLVVNTVLAALDLTSSPDTLWFYWVLGGWGIGLAVHASRVYGGDGKGLKEKLIEREMARDSG